jgi:hypothetical protein
MELRVQAVTIVAITVLAAIGVAVFALLSATQRIPNTVNVRPIGVGVYWDSSFSRKVSSISWGNLHAGETSDVKIYILNEGGVDIVLSMTADNWDSTRASNYITVEWDRESYALGSESSIHAGLTLSVSPNISDVEGFSFDILITGTEA